MKKILLALLLLFLLSPSFAQAFFEPEWSDFCPKRYTNIDSNKLHLTGSARYWADRKKGFEKRLAKCNNLPSEKREACYDSLRMIENDKTNVYSQDRTNRALRYMMMNSRF